MCVGVCVQVCMCNRVLNEGKGYRYIHQTRLKTFPLFGSTTLWSNQLYSNRPNVQWLHHIELYSIRPYKVSLLLFYFIFKMYAPIKRSTNKICNFSFLSFHLYIINITFQLK